MQAVVQDGALLSLRTEGSAVQPLPLDEQAMITSARRSPLQGLQGHCFFRVIDRALGGKKHAVTPPWVRAKCMAMPMLIQWYQAHTADLGVSLSDAVQLHPSGVPVVVDCLALAQWHVVWHGLRQWSVDHQGVAGS